jgi:hypothetical protein
MRRQKQYTDRISIVAEINDHKRKVKQKIEEAEQLDNSATEMFRAGIKEDGEYRRDRARKLRRSAFLIEDGRLKRLKNTLAAFDTQTLPGIVGDSTVVLQ